MIRGALMRPLRLAQFELARHTLMRAGYNTGMEILTRRSRFVAEVAEAGYRA